MVGSRSARLFAFAATVGSALGGVVPQVASTVYVTECITTPTPTPTSHPTGNNNVGTVSSYSTVSAGPVSTLVPALPFAHNSSDITWLDAYDSALLYYAEQPGYHGQLNHSKKS